MTETGKPLLVMMGAEEQIVDDPAERPWRSTPRVPGAQTQLITGAGHSPNVEKPAETTRLVLASKNPPKRRKIDSTRTQRSVDPVHSEAPPSRIRGRLGCGRSGNR